MKLAMKALNNMKVYTSYLGSLYQHIFVNTPIFCWGYFYYDLSGRCLQLMSDKPLLEAFFKNDLFINQILSNDINPKEFYASDIIHDEMLENSIKKTLVDQKYTYFFDIAYNHENYTEVYTFASISSAHKSNNFILNNIDILKVISQDLATRSRRLLTKDNTLILPQDFIIEINSKKAASRIPDNSLNLKKMILERQRSSSKLKEMVNDNVFDFNNLPFNFMSAKQLTLKEKEVVYLYYHGFNVHRIADILDISKRTVDKHFENIKRKLDCDSIGQIIPILMRSNISINQFIQSS
ncbi:LuxR family transcriptional regulator [Legionella oakridgensis]|nr:LuxR family transcriptional regulator [Legionella oakridgensis]